MPHKTHGYNALLKPEKIIRTAFEILFWNHCKENCILVKSRLLFSSLTGRYSLSLAPCSKRSQPVLHPQKKSIRIGSYVRKEKPNNASWGTSNLCFIHSLDDKRIYKYSSHSCASPLPYIFVFVDNFFFKENRSKTLPLSHNKIGIYITRNVLENSVEPLFSWFKPHTVLRGFKLLLTSNS